MKKVRILSIAFVLLGAAALAYGASSLSAGETGSARRNLIRIIWLRRLPIPTKERITKPSHRIRVH